MLFEVVVEEPTVVKTASNLKTRQCFKGGVNWRNGVVKAEGDFLDHVRPPGFTGTQSRFVPCPR